jgi:hypothetical protein
VSGLAFAREKTSSYERLGRFWEAIREPPKLGVDVKVAAIKDAIFQVTYEAHVLLISHYERTIRLLFIFCSIN